MRTFLRSTLILLVFFSNLSFQTFCYLIDVSSDLGFSLYREGYKNVSNVDISSAVIHQMNGMQQRAIRRRDRGRNGPIPGSGYEDIQDVDCKYRHCEAVKI